SSNKGFKQLSAAAQAVGKGMQTIFEGFLQGLAQGNSFVKMLENSLKKLIIKLTAAAAAAGILAAVTGGGFLGILGGLVGIPKLATGGFVSSPTIAMVGDAPGGERSEEHTSELQSRFDLVCRLLL